MSALTLNLYLVRHGETEANVDHRLYRTKSDHAIRLTKRGKQQATETGEFLAEHLRQERDKDPENFGRIKVWYSPYYRARETARYILYPLGQIFEQNSVVTYSDEPFLFEQKAGLFDGFEEHQYKDVLPREADDYEKHVRHHGRIYARSPMGDSRMDVVIRSKPFFGTILRDQQTKKINHVISVNHGVTARAITMGWMHYPPEWLEAEKNPGNGWVRYIHGHQTTGYVDEGYIHGQEAPIRQPMATQKHLVGAADIYMLKPARPNALVPPGVQPLDPFSKPDPI
jgi:2,3-bisphosphoglycerate-dependent phosphoglycerate mutase